MWGCVCRGANRVCGGRGVGERMRGVGIERPVLLFGPCTYAGMKWSSHPPLLSRLDSSRVSYSNPVRQWLYEVKDCTEGGRPKAQAAAEALTRVFPLARAQGRDVSVPMPGHAPANAAHEAQMQKARCRFVPHPRCT